MFQLKIYPVNLLLCSLILLFWVSCKTDSSDQVTNVEAASERVDQIESEVYPKFKEASQYKYSDSLQLLSLGMNDKGFIWVKTNTKNGEVFPVINDYESKYTYKAKKGNLTLTLPFMLQDSSTLKFQLFNSKNYTKSKEYPVELDFVNKSISLKDEAN